MYATNDREMSERNLGAFVSFLAPPGFLFPFVYHSSFAGRMIWMILSENRTAIIQRGLVPHIIIAMIFWNQKTRAFTVVFILLVFNFSYLAICFAASSSPLRLFYYH